MPAAMSLVAGRFGATSTAAPAQAAWISAKSAPGSTRSKTTSRANAFMS